MAAPYSDLQVAPISHKDYSGLQYDDTRAAQPYRLQNALSAASSRGPSGYPW